jgi:competence ComEA-like helix-hairpin-helix protein
MESDLHLADEIGSDDETLTSWDKEQEQELEIDQSDTPDWLQDVAPPSDDTARVQPEETQYRGEAIESEELPEWLQELEEDASEEDIPERYAEHVEERTVKKSETTTSRLPEAELIEGETQPQKGSEIPDDKEEKTAAEQLQADKRTPDESPDWLQDFDSSITLDSDEEVEGMLDLDSADMPEWLRDIAQETPAAIEAGLLSEKDTDDSDIDKADVSELLQDVSDESIAMEEVQESTPIAEDEGLPFSLDDEDAALAWLESLAAKQGVHEEELITHPEDRREISSEEISETIMDEEIESPEEAPIFQPFEDQLADEPEPEIPEWLSDFMEEVPQDMEAEEFESVEGITVETSGESEIPKWLAEFDEEIPEIAETEPEMLDVEDRTMTQATPEPDVPTEAGDRDTKPPIAEAETDISITEPAPAIDRELPDWLIELADETYEEPEEMEAPEPDIIGPVEVSIEEGAEEPIDQIPDEEETPKEAPEWRVETETVQYDDVSEVEPPVEEMEEVIDEGVFQPILDSDELETIEAGEFEPSPDHDIEPEEVVVDKKPVDITDEVEVVKVEPVIEEVPDWIREEAQEPETTVEEIQAEEEEVPTPELVDINTASQDLLKTLKGIGPHLAQSIVSHRETHGSFNNIEDLGKVAGIGPTHLERLQGLITIELVEDISPESLLEGEFETIHIRAVDNLSKGNVDLALGDYDRLLKSEYKLEQVIQELSEATYQHPLDIALLQSLGDAYMRSDQLQDAFEVYNKAEELLR